MLPTLGHDKNISPGSGPTTETNKQKKPSNAADVTFFFFLSTSRACFSSDASSFVSVLSPTGPSLLWPMCSMLILFIPARLNSTWKCEYPRKRNSTPTKLKFNYHSFFFCLFFRCLAVFGSFLLAFWFSVSEKKYRVSLVLGREDASSFLVRLFTHIQHTQLHGVLDAFTQIQRCCHKLECNSIELMLEKLYNFHSDTDIQFIKANLCLCCVCVCVMR